MVVRVRKIRRRRDDGELVIEQTRDLERVAALFAAAGLLVPGLERPGRCYLTASVGVRPVGAAAVATRIDIANLDALAVVAEMRRHGIGSALLAAARAAAHTRGAQTLYALAPPATAEFFRRQGFAAVAIAATAAALTGILGADQQLTSPAAIAGCTAWSLDISRDGIVTR